jgi:hypothetical protein
MSEGVIKVTEKRLKKFLGILEIFLNQFRCGIYLFRVKCIASIVGQVISMQAILGEHARIRNRYLYECNLHRASWNAKVLVSTEAVGECILWHDNVRKMNEIGSQISQFSCNEPQNLHVFCDASETGFGGHLTTDSDDEPLEVFGTWSKTEKVQSSTWSELVAVKRVTMNFKNVLEGKVIRVYTDNKNVAHILKI